MTKPAADISAAADVAGANDAAATLPADATALAADATGATGDATADGQADGAGGGGANGGGADGGAPNGGGDGASADAADSAVQPIDLDDVTPTGAPYDPATLPNAQFTDITTSLGLDPDKVHGPCVAVGDFDNNGAQDFLVVELSGTDATLHTVLLGSGPAKHKYTAVDTTVLIPDFGCSAVDMDGDAQTDLLLGGYSGAAVYRGNGNGTFQDVSAQWMPYVTDFAGFSPTPVDLDGDGDLDLYVGAGYDPPPCTSLDCEFTSSDLLCTINPPQPNTPQLQDRVLLQGDKLPLQDATAQWQVPGGGTQTVVLAMDVDSDGKMDVLAGDDFGGHRLLHNAGGKFDSYDTVLGFHPYAGAMGWGVGDLDGDGLFDLVLAESGPTPVYASLPSKGGLPLKVKDRGGHLGIWWPTWGASAWAPLVADFDHDGLDDVMLGISANFTPEQAAKFINVCEGSKETFDPSMYITNMDLLFTHGKGMAMVPTKLPPGPFPHVVSIDQHVIDLDLDGDLDVVQTRPGKSFQPTSRVRVLRNDLAKQGSSVTVVVRGKGKNQDALGTTVTATIGGKVQRRWLNGSGSWGGTPSRYAHFGLGTAAKATAVTVQWPDGSSTVVGDLEAGTSTQVTWP